MTADSRYLDRVPHIRDELVKCAQAGEITSYTRLGRIVGIPVQGPWQGVLNIVSQNELDHGRPDITHLLASKKTGLSSRIEYKDAHLPNDEQRRRSIEIRKACYQYHRLSVDAQGPGRS